MNAASALGVCAISCALWLSSPATADDEPQLVFTGDILLARNVAREVAQSGHSPWSELQGLFGSSDIVIGNLEGAVGEKANCLAGASAPLCFPVNAALLPLARQAGFTALGLENNHAADLGSAGQQHSAAAVAHAGMLPLTYAASPQFLQVGDHTVGVVAFSRVAGADKQFTAVDLELEQKLDTAHQLSDASIAYVHWGTELLSWPDEAQYSEARLMLAAGADLIVGQHPHVVQAPQCIDGHPVFFSLGNHVFDQKYAATKEGMAAVCRWRATGWQCEGRWTHTGEESSFPVLADKPAATVCAAPARAPLQFGDIRVRAQPGTVTTAPARTLTLELWQGQQHVATARPRVIHRVARMQLQVGIPASLLVLEDHYSPLDGKIAPRPYLYRVAASGLIAQWRGSALAYPLLDVSVLPTEQGDLLCALHKNESFLSGSNVNATAPGLRTLAYRWSGFGFVAAASEAAQARCKQRYARYLYGKETSGETSLSYQ